MNKTWITAALVGAALLATGAYADDQTAAEKAAKTTTVNRNNAPAMGGGVNDKKAMNASEGARDMSANTGMKASGAALNKSEGANDHQH